MSDPAKRRATYQDILGLPAGVTGELVGGELYTQPRPAQLHTFVAGSLGTEIGFPFQKGGGGGPGGWWILPEPELHLGEDILVPDIAGWRQSSLPTFTQASAFTVAPDWICEILSPSTRRKDRMVKLPAYGRHQVKWTWLVDPAHREVEVFEGGADRWSLVGTYGDVDRARIPPFEAIELDLAVLWPPMSESP
jgi:Uma2 family endonuclease